MSLTTADTRRVSIIVPAHNEQDILPGLLRSLRDQEYPDHLVEIIVISNRSSDRTAQVAEAEGARVVIEDRIASSDFARNAGIAVATGEILAFTDADCRPDRLWLQSLIRAMPVDRPAVIAGKVVIEINEDATGAQVYDSMSFLNHEHSIRTRKIAFTANLAVPRLTALKLGGIPTESLTNGDGYFVNLCHKSGIELVYAPSAVVRHRARRSRELFAKIKRIASGNALGGKRATDACGLRFTLQKTIDFFGMPHVAFLNPINIYRHLAARNVPCRPVTISQTWLCGISVLAYGAVWTILFKLRSLAPGPASRAQLRGQDLGH